MTPTSVVVYLIVVALAGLSMPACTTTPTPPAPLVPELVEASDQAKAYAHYMAALGYLREDRQQAAVEEFEQVLKYDPAAVRAAASLAVLYPRAGRYEDAVRVLETAVAAGADNAGIHILLGRMYQQRGRRKDAERQYRRAAAVEPDNAAAYMHLGDLIEGNNDLVEAAWAYKEALRLSPESAVVRQKLGLVYTQMEDYERAAAEFKIATELRPDSSESYFNLGLVLMRLGKVGEAERPLLIALGRNPSSVPVRRLLAGLYCQLERWQDAQEQYAAIARLSGDDKRFREEMALVQMLAGEYEKVIETLAPLGGDTSTRAVTRLLNAGAELRLGRTETAIDQARNIPPFSDNAPIETMLGTVSLFGKTRLTAMYRALLQELIDKGARSEPIYLFLGRLLEETEQLQAAAEALNEALAINPDSKLAHYYLGAVYDLMGDHDTAAVHLKRAIELAPDEAELYNHLGYMYAEQNMHLDEAFELLSKALELEPNNGYVLDSMGWVYYRKGEFDKALEFINRALPNLPTDDAIIRDHLGDVLAAAGRTAEAVAEWRKALTLDPSIEGVQEKLELHGGAAVVRPTAE